MPAEATPCLQESLFQELQVSPAWSVLIYPLLKGCEDGSDGGDLAGHGEALTPQCVGPELSAGGVVRYSVSLQGCF